MKNDNKTKEKKKKGKKGKIIKRILLLILLVLLIACGVFAYRVYKNGGDFQALLMTTLGHDEETVESLSKLYVLILGKSQNLTDTIMLASYDPKTQEAALLSIPRDTFIGDDEDSATAWDKINAVYQTGVDNLLEDVRELTGIDVRYYVTVDTEALVALVDAIGGVTFDVPIDMDYDDNGQDLHIHLEAGEQLLDGDQAEQLVRFRKNNDGTGYSSEYGSDDYGRMRTQREFLAALAEQLLVPSNITKLSEFIDIAKEYVETNMDFDAIKDYIPYAVEFDVDNLKTGVLPGASAKLNGVWIYLVDEDSVEETINELFFSHTETEETDEDGNVISNETSDETSASEEIDRTGIVVEVLNGSGSSTILSEVVADLTAAGYTVNKTGNTTTTSKTAIINRGDVSDSIENDIKEILATGSISNGQSSGDTDVTIIIGTDYVM